MNTKAIVTFVVVMVGMLLGVTALLWNFGSQTGKPVEGVAGDGRHARGSGQVEVVEFSDLQCPACRSVHEPFKTLLAKYDGRVRYTYRHFPLTTIHKNAMVAAYADEAAHLQGKFWEMTDTLFAKQTEWGDMSESDAKLKFVEYATSLGMDEAKFTADMDSQEVKDAVSRDLVDTTRFRLSSTPTFFVNGVETSFAKLETAIEAGLSQ